MPKKIGENVRLTLESPPDIGAPPAAFLDSEFDPADIATLDSLCESLLSRSIETADDLVEYIHHWSELSSSVEGEVARRYIAMTCDTLSDETKERYVSFEREVVSHFRTLDDPLNRKFLESPCREDLDVRFQVFHKRRAQAAEIFRETNTPLFVRDRELTTRWESIQGALTVEFRGETMTPQGSHPGSLLYRLKSS